MIFGRHNLQNIMAAKNACNALGISDKDFLSAISSFKGASKRLELVKKDTETAVYKDFAHAPSKLRATIAAMKEQYPDRRLVACMELHTFSSLTPEFLAQYAGCMDLADVPIVYFNPHAVAHKKLPPLDPEKVRAAFQNDKIHVFTDSALLHQDLTQRNWNGSNLLMMSSGNFDGIDFKELAEEIVGS